MSVEHCWNDKGRGKLMYAVQNLSQCYFFYHESDRDWFGLQLVVRCEGRAWAKTRPS